MHAVGKTIPIKIIIFGPKEKCFLNVYKILRCVKKIA